MLKMEDYNRDLIAVQALLLSRAVHCVFSSVEMTHLISFFFLGGGGFDRRSDGGDPPGAWKERRSDQLAGLVILHSKLCGDLSNAIFFFFAQPLSNTADKDTVSSSSWIQAHTREAEAEE